MPAGHGQVMDTSGRACDLCFLRDLTPKLPLPVSEPSRQHLTFQGPPAASFLQLESVTVQSPNQSSPPWDWDADTAAFSSSPPPLPWGPRSPGLRSVPEHMQLFPALRSNLPALASLGPENPDLQNHPPWPDFLRSWCSSVPGPLLLSQDPGVLALAPAPSRLRISSHVLPQRSPTHLFF